jgi:hypothetical protein
MKAKGDFRDERREFGKQFGVLDEEASAERNGVENTQKQVATNHLSLEVRDCRAEMLTHWCRMQV